jgi:hypothetical protein
VAHKSGEVGAKSRCVSLSICEPVAAKVNCNDMKTRVGSHLQHLAPGIEISALIVNDH